MKIKKKSVVLIVVAIIAVIVIAMFVWGKGSTIPTVSAGTITSSELKQIISVSGKLEANESQVVMLNTMQKISKVHVSEGDVVKVDDIIAEYDKKDIQYQLDKARINLKTLKQQLNNTNTNLTTTDKESATNAVKQAELSLATMQSSYEQVVRSHNNNIELYDGGFLAKEEFLASEKTLADITSQLEGAKMALSTAQGNLTKFNSSGTLQVSSQKDQIAMLQLDIEKLERTLEDSTIRATIAGTVVQLDAKENQFPVGQAMVKIYDLSTYIVNVSISQYDAANVSMGQLASITVKGVDGDFEGTVSKVGSTAEGAAGQEAKVNVEISLSNPSNLIKVGFEADIDLVTASSANALSVSYDSIRQDADGNDYIYIITEGIAPKAEKRVVTLGIETDFDVEILNGVSENDKYIINPADTIVEGSTVKVIEGK